MRIDDHHSWKLSYADAVALQNEYRRKVRSKRLALGGVRFVAGADMSIDKRAGLAFGAVVVYRLPDLECIETQCRTRRLEFPYIPGLLSFREMPVLLDCLKRVKTPFQALICDGQGIAHPRRFGLASHLGVLLQRPTVGCAKSRLIGDHGPVGPRKGDFAPLKDGSERVGSVLRTRDGVKPLYVSPGHLIDQAGARRLVLACTAGYRLPEPTRQADRLSREFKRRGVPAG